jgi:T5SS/PEP-CTERM-associated repeat protein
VRSPHARFAAIAAIWLTFALLCVASPAIATITLQGQSQARLEVSGIDGITLATDHQRVDAVVPFTTFNPSLQSTIHGHQGVELDIAASQNTAATLAPDGSSLTITSSGSFAINHKAPNASDRTELDSNTISVMELTFCNDTPASFCASGSAVFQAPTALIPGSSFTHFSSSSITVGISDIVGFDTGFALQFGLDQKVPVSSGSSSSSLLLPAGCWELDADFFGGLKSPQIIPPDPAKAAANPPTASGNYQLMIEVGPEPPPGNVFPWVGSSGGGFGNAANWKPDNDIPSFVDGSRSDTALFQNLRTPLTVDLSSSAAAAPPPVGVAAPVGQCAGVVTRSIGNLQVDNVQLLEPINGTLALDSLSLDQPSLTVLNGGLLSLDKSALCAQHALIGGGGKTSKVEVTGSGFLQTIGRLSVGRGGIGALDFFNSGVVQSDEVRLGDGDSSGSADVSDATWNTGNIAVGFQSTGELTIENAGLVNSEQGFVASQLPGGPDPGLGSSSGSSCLGRKGSAGGVEVRGANSTWSLQNLFIGPLGCVEVTQGGLLKAIAGDTGLGDVLIGSDDGGNARLLVSNGGSLATANELVVGDGGAAQLVLTEAGGSQVNVAQELAIGNGGTTETFGEGHVTVNGAGTGTDTVPSLTSNAIDIGVDGGTGSFDLNSGALVKTSTTARVGTDGVGQVRLNGPAATTWQIGQSLTIGSGFVAVADSIVDIGTDSAPGQIVINGGNLAGSGQVNIVLTHGGTITNNGLIQAPLGISGNYLGSSTGKIIGKIAGLASSPAVAPTRAVSAAKTPAPPQGPIVISGNADFTNTTLELSFVNGFAPKQGNAFQVVQVTGTATGAFANVQIDGLAPGASFAVDPATGNATAMTDTAALPVVTIKGPKTVKESAKAGAKLTFTRKGDTSAPMTVNYQVSGSATNGIDYATLPGTFVIPAKKKSATLAILPYNDGYFEPTETIEVELLPGDQYSVGLTSKVSIDLLNVDPKIKKIKKK